MAHHRFQEADVAFQIICSFGGQVDVEQHVLTFALLADQVSKFALAPNIHFADAAACIRNPAFDAVDRFVKAVSSRSGWMMQTSS